MLEATVPGQCHLRTPLPSAPWRAVRRLLAPVAMICAMAVPSVRAQTPTGTIEGRVLNQAAGEYLNNAHVTIAGTDRETLTDSFGQYRFTDVPVGPVTVQVAYTGFPTQTETTTVTAGTVATADFSLRPGETVKMDAYVVAGTKETNPYAIAINEQRYAPNIKTVVSASEYGSNPSGNVGDFLKFLPGVRVDSNGGDARYISLNGTPPQYVPVTINGFNLANAASNTTSRTVELEQASLNNIDRVEIVESPTPESPGNALAGSVNLVPRSAFERSRPVFNYNAFLMSYDDLKGTTKQRLGRNKTEFPMKPGGSFSYIVPVNSRFGFSLSAATSAQARNQYSDTLTWFGTLSTPPSVGGVRITDNSNPYLGDVVIADNPGTTERTSWSATLDFKPTRYDVFSFGIQWAYNHVLGDTHSFHFAPSGVPVSFSPYYTHGAVNSSIMLDNSGTINKAGTTWMPTLTWRHNGPIWKADAGIGYSHSTSRYRSANGGAADVSLRRQGDITINYDNNFYLRPGTVTVTDRNGNAVNPYILNSYSMQSVSDIDREGSDLQRSVYGNLGRTFDLGRMPLALKTGFDVRQQQRDLDDFGNRTWTYIGPDGKRNLTPVGNNSAVPFLLDQQFSERYAPFGFPQVQYPSPWLAADLVRTHPEWFTPPTPVNLYNAYATNSKFIQETVSAVFIRGDAHFFNNRLAITTGVRVEQTNDKAESVRVDASANYARDASGKPIFDANNKHVLINPAGSLEEAELVRQARGAHIKKEYLRYFPSFNASYNITQNLVFRGAYYWSLGRPDLGQYAGGLTLPDLESPPSSSNRISVNNPNIKPWKAYTTKFTLEYYMKSLGIFSVDVFRRDFKNFFVGTLDQASPAFLAAAGLPETYLPYDVATQRNSPYPVRVTGIMFNYKHALDFLPHWARGISVTANETSQKVTGIDAGNITSNSFPTWTASAGIRFDRDRFSMMVNESYQARFRQNYISATDSWVYYNRRAYIDVEASYWLTKNRTLGIYLNGANLRDQPESDNEVAGTSTPAVAQMRSITHYGVRWTLGLKGSF